MLESKFRFGPPSFILHLRRNRSVVREGNGARRGFDDGFGCFDGRVRMGFGVFTSLARLIGGGRFVGLGLLGVGWFAVGRHVGVVEDDVKDDIDRFVD